MHDFILSVFASTSIDYPVAFKVILRSPKMDVAFDSPEDFAAFHLEGAPKARQKGTVLPSQTENLPGHELIPTPPFDGAVIGASSEGCNLVFPTIGPAAWADWEWKWLIHEDTNGDGDITSADEPGWVLVQVNFAALTGEADSICS